MTPSAEIVEVGVATVDAPLPSPVIFGDWIMTSREYAVVRIRLRSGLTGWSFGLTRSGAVAEQIRKSLKPIYVGTSVVDRERVFKTAWRRSLSSHASGVGLRALSLVDLAVWDAAARTQDVSIAALLGGSNEAMPATAIVGYPPASMGPRKVHEQTRALSARGWRRFKVAVAATEEMSAARLRAIRAAAPDAWIGCDGAWLYDDAREAAEFANSISDVGIGWFEDALPPGDTGGLKELRARTSVPIAMGDEQGGSYYPQALIAADAVDVVRIDLTCMGGISGGRRIVDECLQADVEFAPHMFAHVHSQVLGALGHDQLPIEWGDPGTGVDPFADSLAQPEIDECGRMRPLPESPGFGQLLNTEWLRTSSCVDPEAIL